MFFLPFVWIDGYLFGVDPPWNFISFLDKFPNRVSSMAGLIDFQPPVPEKG